MKRLALLAAAGSLLLVIGAAGCGSKTGDEDPAGPATTGALGERTGADAGGDGEAMRAMCPMHVEGVAISAVETPDGAAIAFVIRTGDVGDLRRRVAHMAAMHGAMHDSCAGGMGNHGGGMGGGMHEGGGMGGGMHEGGGMGGGMHEGGGMGGGMHEGGGMGGGMHEGGGMGQGEGACGMTMMRATAAAEDVDGGARIVFTPAKPSQLEALRGEVRRHAERMQAGECPMGMMGGGMGGGEGGGGGGHDGHHGG